MAVRDFKHECEECLPPVLFFAELARNAKSKNVDLGGHWIHRSHWVVAHVSENGHLPEMLCVPDTQRAATSIPVEVPACTSGVVCRNVEVLCNARNLFFKV